MSSPSTLAALATQPKAAPQLQITRCTSHAAMAMVAAAVVVTTSTTPPLQQRLWVTRAARVRAPMEAIILRRLIGLAPAEDCFPLLIAPAAVRVEVLVTGAAARTREDSDIF